MDCYNIGIIWSHQPILLSLLAKEPRLFIEINQGELLKTGGEVRSQHALSHL
jgi:hypothetical protein